MPIPIRTLSPTAATRRDASVSDRAADRHQIMPETREIAATPDRLADLHVLP